MVLRRGCARQAKLEEMRAAKGAEAEGRAQAQASWEREAAARKRAEEERREARRTEREARARRRAARTAGRAAAGRAYAEQRREMARHLAQCEAEVVERHRAEAARASEWRRRRDTGELPHCNERCGSLRLDAARCGSMLIQFDAD